MNIKAGEVRKVGKNTSEHARQKESVNKK